VAGHLLLVVDGVAYGLLLYVVAAGLTLTFGVGGVLNLAHGSLYAIGAYTAAVLADGTWTSLAAAAALGAAAASAAGGLLAVALRPVTSRGHLAQALLTFGVALTIAAVLVEVFGPDELRPPAPSVLDRAVHIAGHGYPGYRLVFIAAAGLLAVAGRLVLARTRAGSRVRAAVDDPHMLATIGVSPRRVTTAVMAVGGGLAGLAGALGAPILGAGPRTGELVLLLSLVIVVVGGIGSLRGAFVAAIAVGQVQTVGVVALPGLAPYLLFAAMAAVLLLRRTPVNLLGAHP